jgi:hypothetical protein
MPLVTKNAAYVNSPRKINEPMSAPMPVTAVIVNHINMIRALVSRCCSCIRIDDDSASGKLAKNTPAIKVTLMPVVDVTSEPMTKLSGTASINRPSLTMR